jgi:hypothetical protein
MILSVPPAGWEMISFTGCDGQVSGRHPRTERQPERASGKAQGREPQGNRDVSVFSHLRFLTQSLADAKP